MRRASTIKFRLHFLAFPDASESFLFPLLLKSITMFRRCLASSCHKSNAFFLRRPSSVESPVWCPEDNALYWVDIKRPAVHRFSPITGSCETWPMKEEVTSIGLRQSGGAIASLRSSIATINFLTGEVCKLPGPIVPQPDMRFNDGRCDRGGRFWVGTLHEARQPETASLYRFDPDGRHSEMIAGVTVSNGIAWSLDNRVMYFADSWARTIFKFDFDLDSGTVHNRRVFVQLPEGAGVPDGATVDAEGFLWSATFDGGCVIRYAPDGSTDRVIRCRCNARPVALSAEKISAFSMSPRPRWA